MNASPIKVLILSTLPRFTLNLVRSAAIAGFQPLVVTDRHWAMDTFSRYVCRRVVIDQEQLLSGHPQAIAQINRLIQQYQVDVIVAADTRCTRMLARCQDQIQGAAIFPLSAPELIDQLYDKWQFAQVLAKHHFPMPETHLIQTPEQVQQLDCKFPVIVKPYKSEGGKNLPRFDHRETLQSYIQEQANQNTLPLLLQEWLPGKDLGINVLADQGELIAWSIQQPQINGIEFINHPEIVEMGQALCRAVSYHGVGNIDLRMDDHTGKVTFIEFNPRFWATSVYSTWMGVNFLAAGIQLIRDDLQLPAFQPVQGLCQYPWPTRSALVEYWQRGFQPPMEWLGDRERAWRSQIFDPIPEWCDWLLGHQKAPQS